LRRVLDQQQIVFVAPCAPASGILRKPEVVDKVESTHIRAEERLEVLLVRLQTLVLSFVEATNEAGSDKRLDLRTVMVRRHEYLITRLEAKGLGTYEQSLASQGKDAAVRFL